MKLILGLMTGQIPATTLKRNLILQPACSGPSGANYIYFRYTEVLLGYAEAQNEAVGPDASVYSAINTIRARVGLPGFTLAYHKARCVMPFARKEE